MFNILAKRMIYNLYDRLEELELLAAEHEKYDINFWGSPKNANRRTRLIFLIAGLEWSQNMVSYCCYLPNVLSDCDICKPIDTRALEEQFFFDHRTIFDEKKKPVLRVVKTDD